jgi:hypothetical protein
VLILLKTHHVRSVVISNSDVGEDFNVSPRNSYLLGRFMSELNENENESKNIGREESFLILMITCNYYITGYARNMFHKQ